MCIRFPKHEKSGHLRTTKHHTGSLCSQECKDVCGYKNGYTKLDAKIKMRSKDLTNRRNSPPITRRV